MTMTRRETLVAFLQEDNGFSEALLKAAFAVPGCAGFLTQAQSLGLTNEELAERLVAFKQGGGSGLQAAIETITKEFNGTPDTADNSAYQGVLADIQAQLHSLAEKVAELS
jgi:hypothetical protein